MTGRSSTSTHVTTSTQSSRGVFVSDFDGTIARPDFYQLVRRDLLPPGTPDFWVDYRAGRLTHFEALKSFFEAAEGGEEALRGLIDKMQMPDDLSGRIDQLRSAGWDVVVVSVGCLWYIDILLKRAGVDVPVHANPGRIVNGRLIMELPSDSDVFCEENGIDKSAVVRRYLEANRPVAFAGDGYPDLAAARLVPEDRRFAREDLAEACRNEGLRFRPFDRWDEVAEALRRDHPDRAVRGPNAQH